MKRTIALIIIVVLMVFVLAACQPAEPEVQEIEKPQAVAPEEPAEPEVVEEEPVPEEPVEVFAQALYDGVYVLYGTAARGDVFSVTGETEDYYKTEIEGIPVLIEKKYLRLDSQ